MTSEKKRKKSAAAVTTDVTTSAISSEPVVAVLDTAPLEDGEDLSPVIQAEVARDTLEAASRPAWVDGLPVTIEGRPIREKFEPPRAFMAPTDQTDQTPQEDSQNSDQQHGRNWGDPYKTIFNCPEMGFELGENRRFKQRTFKFDAKPSAEILDALKEHGFIYRATEKAWTIAANADTRKLTDELARQWAGPNYVRGIER